MLFKSSLRIAVTSLALCLPTVPYSAQAASSSVDFHITAFVDVFCQISSPESEPIEITQGSGLIGNVREICNTPSGYTVTTSFTNLSGGILEAAGENLQVDTSGQAIRTSNQAAVKTSSWRLAQVTTIEPTAPVFMRVTIAPR